MKRWILSFIMLCQTSCLLAAGESCEKPQKTQVSRSIAAFDAFHTWCSKGIIKLANKVDYFFGKTRVDEESNETYGRVIFQTRFQESESIDFSTRQRIRLNLPGTEKKIKLIFDKNSSDEQEVDTVLSNPQTNNANNGFDAAVRYVVKRKAKFNTQFDGGGRVKRHRPFNPFVRMRNRFTWDVNDFLIIRFVNQAFYFIRTYGVIDNQLDFDIVFKDKSILRWGHSLNWEDRNDYYRFSQGLSYLKEVNKKKAYGINFFATGDNQFKTTYTNYVFFFQYRQQIYKDWLFMEVRPEVNWPKIRDFKSQFSVTLRLEFLFGNY